jgi:hypothetical protein
VLFSEANFYVRRTYATGGGSLEAKYYFDTSNYDIAALNSDSSLLSVLLSTDTQAVTQYQFVFSCQSYQAIEGNTTCSCTQYEGLFCAPASDPFSSSFPLYAVAIAAVGGLGTLGLS